MAKFKNDFHKKRFQKHLKNPIEVSEEEIEEIKKLYEIEYEWWADEKPFKTNKDIESAFKEGTLVQVEEDENIKPIMRLQNPDLEKWLPYLDKKTNELLIEIGKQWREIADEMNIYKGIKLSITSLTRSAEYQKEIMEMGKMAVEKSSHTKGKSFDIDGCGYYIDDDAINPRFTEDYENKYNPKIHQILENILIKMRDKGLINFIPEYVGTNNQCFHVTRAPEK